jgi:hypothetical protein
MHATTFFPSFPPEEQADTHADGESDDPTAHEVPK